jgi:hypothetical protein
LQSFSCATFQCNQEETLVHLFWSCPFAELCWDFICPQRTRDLSVLEAFNDIKEKLKLLCHGYNNSCCLLYLDFQE